MAVASTADQYDTTRVNREDAGQRFGVVVDHADFERLSLDLNRVTDAERTAEVRVSALRLY